MNSLQRSTLKQTNQYSPSVNHLTSTVTHWRAVRGLDSPKEKADHINLSGGDAYRTPIRIQPLAEEMNRSFNNYEAFRRDMQPEASKANYQKFLGSLQA